MNQERKITVRGYDEYQREEFCNEYRALEVKDKINPYGNGMHILVVDDRDNQFAHLDCRYHVKYNFDTILQEWAERYWSKNLRYLRICEPHINIVNVTFEACYNKDLKGATA